MGQVASFEIDVPGARLHVELRGSGSVLLIVPGGPTDASTYDLLAAELASRYKVVVYDPRGNSRSILTAQAPDQPVETHADDALKVLTAVTDERVCVVGFGTGALAGLELAARHSDLIRTLIAHEPPATSLLPESERWQRLAEEVYEIYRSEGVAAASTAFDRGLGLRSTASPGMGTRVPPNLDFYYAHVMRPVSEYEPSMEACRRSRLGS